MNLKLDRAPDPGPLMLKALGTLRRRPPEQVVLPELAVELPALRFDAGTLAAYRQVCGFGDGAVPMTYPQVAAIGLQMHLLLQPQFPLPLLGLVHLRNHIQQVRELGVDESFQVRVALGEHRATPKGLEFDIKTTFADGQEQPVWSATAGVLFRRKGEGGGRKPPPAPEPAGLAHYQVVDAPADIGRRYGRIAGDNNPIHLYPLTARLFGYPRPIAHGMWSLARSCALLQPRLGHPPRELEAKFIKPLFLPGRASLRYFEARGDGGAGLSFRLLGRDGDQVHLSGVLR